MSKYCLVLPVRIEHLAWNIDLQKPYDLGNGVKIEPTPSWVKKDKIAKSVKNKWNKGCISNWEYSIITEIVEYERELSDEGDKKQYGDNFLRNSNKALSQALEKIRQVNISIWLTKEIDAHCNFFICLEKEEDTWEYKLDRKIDPYNRI